MVVESSPILGSCNANCTRKFIINFRRNKQFDPKSGVGFDWFRPEYEENLTRIFKDSNAINPLFKGNIKNLKKTYKFNGIPSISPYGVEYIPSILSIFSQKDTKLSKYIKEKQKNGITLDIETYQIIGDDHSPLEGVSAKCKFTCINPNIEISPQSMNLSELVGNGYAQDLLRDRTIQIARKNKKFYRKENAINIKINGFLSEDVEIIVWAEFPNGQLEKVGQMIVCKNNEDKYINIQPVKLITNTDYNLPKYENDLESFFAQALIKVKFLKEDEIDLNSRNNEICKNFLLKYNDEKNDFTKKFKSENEKVNYLLAMRDDIVEFYNNLRDVRIDEVGHKKTYLIFIDLFSQAYSSEKELKIKLERKKRNLAIDQNEKYGRTKVGGVATQKSDNTWGNGTIIYKPVILNYDEYAHTVAHELGHSLGLSHVFEDNDNGFEFHEGYSDNIMDYGFTENDLFERQDNPFSKGIGYFSKNDTTMNKFQWEIIRNDESINS